MPQHAKPDVILRQWEMLRLIPAHDHPGRSAADLTAALASRGYRVTRRTVERDLEHLQPCLPLDVDTQRRPQRWRWRKSRGLDIPGMEAAEAMALIMMRDALAARLPSCLFGALRGRFAQADRTLVALARGGAKVRWTDRMRVLPAHVAWQPQRIAPRILQTLQRALLHDIAVEARYRPVRSAAPQRRLLYPRALILRGSTFYLIAHRKNGGAAPHRYAVQRFSSVRLRKLEPWRPAPFSLDAFLASHAGPRGDGHEIRAHTLRGTA
jgi:predicted DNA-binding transcriptional regulator YafY